MFCQKILKNDLDTEVHFWWCWICLHAFLFLDSSIAPRFKPLENYRLDYKRVVSIYHCKTQTQTQYVIILYLSVYIQLTMPLEKNRWVEFQKEC